MMNRVIHHPSAKTSHPRHGEDSRAVVEKGPVLAQVRVIGSSEDARAAATFLSNSSDNSARDRGTGGGVKGLPPGDISNESCSIVSTAHPTRLARCPASQPMLPDFSCGFHENFSSGTRSRVLRVLAIS